MRLAVYTDYAYRRDSEGVYAERAFALFLAHLADYTESLTLLGRVRPEPGRSHYRLPDAVEFAELPFYESIARPLSALWAMARSVVRFRKAVAQADVVWVLGPHPLAILFAVVGRASGKRVVLGVRQDTPSYAESRHPGRRAIALAARALDRAFKALARPLPVVVVGPALAQSYAHARESLVLFVSLVGESELADDDERRRRLERDESARWTVLTVGRIETEKNPLLLPDILAELDRGTTDKWHLIVCGEGPLAPDLAERFAESGAESSVQMTGYVPLDDGLRDLYRSADLFLHVSWTEGFPQTLIEAAAAALPVVATAVGGVPAGIGDAALLIPPDDAPAAARALDRLALDRDLRAKLIDRGLSLARERTTEAECRRLADFLAPGSKCSGPTARA